MSKHALALAAAVLVGVLATGIAGVALWPVQPPHPVIRFATPIPIGVAIPAAAISHDGKHLAIRSAGLPSQIYVRKLGEFDTRPIPATSDAAPDSLPCFSPDGDWIAYSTGKTLKKVSVAGGAAQTVADDLDGADLCDWGEDGNIYFGGTPGIMRVTAAGGRAELVTAEPASGESGYSGPHLLPGGARLLLTVVRGGLNDLSLAVLDLTTHEKKILLEGAGFATYAPSGPGSARGYLLYGRDGVLFAAPFDTRTLTAGPPSPVLEGIARVGPIAFASVSDNGTLVYTAGGDFELGMRLQWADRAGTVQALPAPVHTYGDLSLSPDGRRAAVSIADLDTLMRDLWLYEIDGDRLTRLTFGGFNVAPVWMPDGRRMIYWHSDGANFYDGELRAAPADNSAPPVTLAPLRGSLATPTSISADATVLVGSLTHGADHDLWSLPLGDAAASSGGQAGATLMPLLGTAFDEHEASLSPDARYLAYTSNESGRDEVYVIPYPGPGAKTQVSTAGGSMPRWNPSGGELFYASGTQLLAVEVETSPVFRRLTPKVLFEAPSLANPITGGYDVAPDGSRFLMTANVGTGRQFELRVVVNWFEELRRLALAK